MPFKVVIEPRALRDIQQAIDYYDEQSVGLEERFVTSVSSCINAISINPFYRIRYKDYRAFPMGKFPFLLIYHLDETVNTAYIIAVFHTSQNPDKLPK